MLPELLEETDELLELLRDDDWIGPKPYLFMDSTGELEQLRAENAALREKVNQQAFALLVLSEWRYCPSCGAKRGHNAGCLLGAMDFPRILENA